MSICDAVDGRQMRFYDAEFSVLRWSSNEANTSR